MNMSESQVAANQDYVYAIAVSPTFQQDGVCFAARQTGLYRSDDGGESWQYAFASLNLAEPLATTSVLLSPEFATDQTVFAGAPGGVLRSINGGETWQVALLGTPPPAVSALVISPNYLHDGVLLAATLEDGIYRSADRGKTWSAWNFGLLDMRVMCLGISPDFATDETVFAGTESGLFRSTNGGRAWREVALPIGFEPVLSLAVVNDGENLFIGTEQGLYTSSDQGNTWLRLGENVLDGHISTILSASDLTNLLVLNDDAPYFSPDGGQSWQPCPLNITAEKHLATIAAPEGIRADVPLIVGLTTGNILSRKIEL